ncbi:unnamed protein product [Mytilus edulis]|uniref:Uncharacterized protein n=1 Tax=Mytilus edulis TaxID=6550 RepID=A0A8S3SJH1_MYTED|nr:unnamed protein product [Mytilus edulis]
MCKNRRINAIEEESDSEDELYIGCIENQKKSENSWMVNLNLNGKNQKFKLDTGAQANVIPYKVLKLVKGDTKIIPSKTRLVTYSGEKMDVLGKCYINVSHKDKIERMEFAVVNFNAQCILGLSACEKLNLINRVMSVEKSAESILKENKTYNGRRSYIFIALDLVNLRSNTQRNAIIYIGAVTSNGENGHQPTKILESGEQSSSNKSF